MSTWKVLEGSIFMIVPGSGGLLMSISVLVLVIIADMSGLFISVTVRGVSLMVFSSAEIDEYSDTLDER